jgi:hypothetical protein
MGEIIVEIIVHHLSFMRYSWETHGALRMTLLVGTCHFWVFHAIAMEHH